MPAGATRPTKAGTRTTRTTRTAWSSSATTSISTRPGPRRIRCGRTRARAPSWTCTPRRSCGPCSPSDSPRTSAPRPRRSWRSTRPESVRAATPFTKPRRGYEVHGEKTSWTSPSFVASCGTLQVAQEGRPLCWPPAGAGRPDGSPRPVEEHDRRARRVRDEVEDIRAAAGHVALRPLDGRAVDHQRGEDAPRRLVEVAAPRDEGQRGEDGKVDRLVGEGEPKRRQRVARREEERRCREEAHEQRDAPPAPRLGALHGSRTSGARQPDAFHAAQSRRRHASTYRSESTSRTPASTPTRAAPPALVR